MREAHTAVAVYLLGVLIGWLVFGQENSGVTDCRAECVPVMAEDHSGGICIERAGEEAE